MMRSRLGALVCAAADKEGTLEMHAFPKFFSGSTQKVCQLTGDFDKERQEPTLSRTDERCGVIGTDLGIPVEHKGRLYLLFGDVQQIKGDRWLRDPIGYTTSTDPERIEITFLTDEDGLFRPLTIPGISQLGFEVPGGAIALGDSIYVVFTTDHSTEKMMGRSVLAASEDDAHTFENLYDLSTDKFINVAMAKVRPSDVPGLPTSTDTVLMWGSGAYRRSNPYLACVPVEDIRDQSAIRYYAGKSKSGKPRWKNSEAAAVPLFPHPQIGEVSVVWCDQVQHWLMLYNSHIPFGIVYRFAKEPWGPWSDTAILFSPDDKEYGQFIHLPEKAEPGGVNLSDRGHEQIQGGAYGPYLIERYFHGDAQRCTVYFAMSIWNPYQVVLMRADIGCAASEET